MKQLPDSYCIKRDADNPLWIKFVKSLNSCFKGGKNYYGDLHGARSGWDHPPSSAIIITLKEWDAIVNPKFKIGDWVVWSGQFPAIGKIYAKDYEWGNSWSLEVNGCRNTHPSCNEMHLRHATPEEIKAATSFVLPEKWAIKVTNSIITDWLNDHATNGCKNYIYKECASEYLHYPDHLGYHMHSGVQNGYTEITLDQFKKYVLKQDTMGKKIIGYKWKEGFRNKYEKAAIEICNSNKAPVTNLSRNAGSNCMFVFRSMVANAIEQAGVLNLWFEPVYEEEEKEFILRCTGGTFRLHVSKKGIYYKPDGRWLSVPDLDSAVNPNELMLYRSEIPDIGQGSGHYDIQQHISHLSMGCKKHVPVEDIQAVLDYYCSLQ